MTGTKNFLALEPELVARLKECLSDRTPSVHVLSAADLAGVAEDKQLSPAVHVVYQGYRVLETLGAGAAARVEQTWLAVVATRNVRDTKQGSAARADSGSLAATVLQALMGWRAPCAAKALQLTGGPSAGFGSGHHYLPLAFTTELAFTNKP